MARCAAQINKGNSVYFIYFSNGMATWGFCE